MVGKAIRLERIIDRGSGRTVIIPMDHGVSSGPIRGITDLRDAVGLVAEGGANAVVEHKGQVARGHRRGGSDVGLIVHLSGSTSLSPDPDVKTLVCSAEEALKLGADGISVHVNIGNGHENEMLSQLGRAAQSAMEWGLPLLAMIYPRGDRVKNEFDPGTIRHAARLGAELGADLVKVSYTGDPESFSRVVDGCHVPVIIAGGPKMDSDRALLEMVRGAINAGAAGTSIGRNVFQHSDPTGIVGAISMIVHKDASVEDAIDFLHSRRNDER